MCTYATQVVAVEGSGKGPTGWFRLTSASVYLDHPVHAAAEHTLNIDFRNPDQGAAARVAVELDPGAARELAEAILGALGDPQPARSPAIAATEPPPAPRRRGGLGRVVPHRGAAAG